MDNALNPNSEYYFVSVTHSGVRPVSFSDWQKIDDVEESRGVEKGKPREKITTIQEWMEVVGH